MNCLSCISSDYVYQNETYNCILPSEFDKTENQEISKNTNGNFIIYIVICFIIVIIIIITIFCCVKKNKIKNVGNDKYKQILDDERNYIPAKKELNSIN